MEAGCLLHVTITETDVERMIERGEFDEMWRSLGRAVHIIALSRMRAASRLSELAPVEASR